MGQLGRLPPDRAQGPVRPPARRPGRADAQAGQGPEGRFETIHVDGQAFRRRLPKPGTASPDEPGRPTPAPTRSRAPGGNDPGHRIKDLDGEGVWAEVIYPSLGIWSFNIRTPQARHGRGAGPQRLGPELPAAFAAVRLRRVGAAPGRRRRGRRAPTGRRAPGSAARSCRCSRPVAAPTGNTMNGSRCGRPSPRPGRSSASTSVPSRTTRPGGRGSTSAARAVRCSTTSRRPTAASARHQAHRLRRARPLSRASGPRLGGRRDLGAVPR